MVNSNGPSSRVALIGHTSTGQAVKLITLKTEKLLSEINEPASVKVCTLGAALVSCIVPGFDENGRLILGDVALGYKEVDGYEKNPAYLGVIVGRVCGRIGNGQFVVPTTGEVVQLTRNLQDKHCLHGGIQGLSRVVWDIENVTPASVTLRHISPHGDEGFPGTLSIQVEYSLSLVSETVELAIRYQAKLTSPFPHTVLACPINLTNHACWNLAGHSSGCRTLSQHQVEIAADTYVELDPISLVPTGRLLPVEGTVRDFRQLGPLLPFSDKLASQPGHDTYYVFHPKSEEEPCASLYHAQSGRWMRLFTDQPGVQFYTGHYIDPLVDAVGKHGEHYVPSGGLCLEAQGFPDASNQPTFPSMFIHSDGEAYTQSTFYRFDTCHSL